MSLLEAKALTREFDDGRVVLRPLAAALDLAQCGLQDLKKMAGL